MLLPPSNIPSNQWKNVQLVDADASKNFGDFTLLAGSGSIDHGLAIEDYSALKGYKDVALGTGIKTTVCIT